MNTSGGGYIMGSYPYPRNGLLKIDYEFVLIFKKDGETPAPSKEIKEQSKLTKEEWNTYFSSHWNFRGAKQKEHLASFPEELPKRLIKMFSFVGETVLDPFLGSGTTSQAAKNLNRNSIGYEINNEFLSIIKNKLNIIDNALWNDIDYEIIYQEKTNINWNDKIKELPYIFKDYTKIKRIIDPKTKKFKSKIYLDDLKK